jgi:hypothetical protein
LDSLRNRGAIARKKQFDTSGKSAALIYHHAICRTPAPPDSGRFRVVADKKSLTENEVASTHARRAIAGALPNRALVMRVPEETST